MNFINKIAKNILHSIRNNLKKTIFVVIEDELYDYLLDNPVTAELDNVDISYEPDDYEDGYLRFRGGFALEEYDVDFENQHFTFEIKFQKICQELNCDFEQLSKSDKNKLQSFIKKLVNKTLKIKSIIEVEYNGTLINDLQNAIYTIKLYKLTKDSIIMKSIGVDFKELDYETEIRLLNKYEEYVNELKYDI